MYLFMYLYTLFDSGHVHIHTYVHTYNISGYSLNYTYYMERVTEGRVSGTAQGRRGDSVADTPALPVDDGLVVPDHLMLG